MGGNQNHYKDVKQSNDLLIKAAHIEQVFNGKNNSTSIILINKLIGL